MFQKGNTLGKLCKGMRKNVKEIKWQENVNGCWICTSHVPNTYGYPQCRINYKFRNISHIMYERYKGEIPKGLCVLHTCDNPSCINPAHLFLGTNADNSADMVKKNRQSHIGSPGMNGEKHPQAKLKEAQVIEIIKSNEMQKELALKFSVSQAVISKIKLGESWKHIDREAI
jgi:hypothetical protein